MCSASSGSSSPDRYTAGGVELTPGASATRTSTAASTTTTATGSTWTPERCVSASAVSPPPSAEASNCTRPANSATARTSPTSPRGSARLMTGDRCDVCGTRQPTTRPVPEWRLAIASLAHWVAALCARSPAASTRKPGTGHERQPGRPRPVAVHRHEREDGEGKPLTVVITPDDAPTLADAAALALQSVPRGWSIALAGPPDGPHPPGFKRTPGPPCGQGREDTELYQKNLGFLRSRLSGPGVGRSRERRARRVVFSRT